MENRNKNKMYVSTVNITPDPERIKLADLPTGTAFRVNNNLYVKPDVLSPPPVQPEHLLPVINIQQMLIAYWHKDTYVQPVRIREAEIKYDDLYGENI